MFVQELIATVAGTPGGDYVDGFFRPVRFPFLNRVGLGYPCRCSRFVSSWRVLKRFVPCGVVVLASCQTRVLGGGIHPT